MLKKVVSIGIIVFLSGCATVFTGTNQAIQVNAADQQTAEPLSRVNCTITDSSGAVYALASNPGTAIISKGKGPLQVNCSQAGYKTYTGAINSSFNPVTILDIFLWPTFFVDIATGAFQKYPSSYLVMMTKK